MFKINDYISYVFYSRLKVVGEDEKHYLLEDPSGGRKNIYKELVDKYGKLIPPSE